MKYVLLLFIYLYSSIAYPQNSINKKRFVPLIIVSSAGYAGGLIGMNELWYKKNSRTKFHFFNDVHEWNQVDKAGHFTTAAVESMYYIEFLKWSGFSERKANLWGPLTGFILQAPIELLDGFSAAYGASVSDLAANALGAAFICLQRNIWKSVKIQPKFSFHTTPYAMQRPNVLGATLPQKLLKDYNGQTYWFSFNIESLIKNTSRIPWLNISLGYGAEEMIYAERELNVIAGLHPYRQYFISLDVDFTKIPTKSKFLKALFYNLNFVHLPLPALEFSQKKFNFHLLYY